MLGVVYAAAAFDWRLGVLVPVPLAGRDKARRLEATGALAAGLLGALSVAASWLCRSRQQRRLARPLRSAF